MDGHGMAWGQGNYDYRPVMYIHDMKVGLRRTRPRRIGRKGDADAMLWGAPMKVRRMRTS